MAANQEDAEGVPNDRESARASSPSPFTGNDRYGRIYEWLEAVPLDISDDLYEFRDGRWLTGEYAGEIEAQNQPTTLGCDENGDVESQEQRPTTVDLLPVKQDQRPSNVFQVHELPKLVLILAVALIPGVIILNAGHDTITRAVATPILLLLVIAVTLIWNAIVLQHRYPVIARRILLLGFAFVWAAVFGLIAGFLWPYHFFSVPIACWVVTAGILASRLGTTISRWLK